jgi:GAF domain-containing protein/CheY-like chemotaxis protein
VGGRLDEPPEAPSRRGAPLRAPAIKRALIARRLETLTRLAQTLTETLSLDAVLQRVADAAVELFGSSIARVWLVDEDGAHVSLRASSGSQTSVEGVGRFRIGEGLVGTVVATRSPLTIPDVLGDPRTRNVERIRAEGTVSVALVPVLLGDRALGALSIGVRQRHEYTVEEMSVLGSLTLHAANAINNARRFEDERARRAHLAALLEINKKIGRVTEMESLLASIAEEAARLLGVDNAGFRLVDGDELVLAGLAGTAAETMVRARIRIGESLSGKVVAEGRTVACELESGGLIPEHLAANQRFGYTTFLGVPLTVGDRTIGVLTFRARHPFTARDQELAEAFAGQAAIALEQLRLHGEATRQAQRMAALADIGRLLSETLDFDRVAQRVADSVCALLGARSSCLYRVDTASGGLVAVTASTDSGAAFYWTGALPEGTGIAGLAVRERRPVASADVLADPRVVYTPEARARVAAETHRALLAIPLLVQGRLFGALAVSDRVGRRFADEEVRLAQAFADQAALALENARLYTEAQERLRETTTLMNVGQILSRPGPTGERMRQVAREVARVFGADMVGAYFLDARKEALVPLGGYRVPKELLDTFLSRPMVLSRFPALVRLMRAGRAISSPDTRSDGRFDREWVGMLPPHSVLFASAIARGEPIGGLFVVWWRTGRQFPPAELRLIESVAAQVGLAMENAELARQTQVKLRETETLLSVSRSLASTPDLQALLRHFLRTVTKAVDADSAGVWMLGADGELMEGIAGYRVPPAVLADLSRVSLSIVRDGFYAEAARTKRPVFSSDVAADARVPDSIKHGAPHRAQLFVPIVAKERLIGGFALIWWDRTRELSEAELALMEAIANQAGVAIEHARLFEEHRRQVEELSVLHELSQAVTGQLDRAALVDAIHTQVARVLDPRNMLIVLRDQDRGEFEVALRIVDGLPDLRPPLRYPAGSVGLVSAVFDTGRAVRTDDYVGECARRGVEAVAASAQLRHWLGVPMSAEDTVLGVLALRGGQRAFTEADERLLTNIAHLAALALRSARLFEERTHAYRELATAQDQLVRTEKLRALGEMASGVAHDFNNLLASILGRAQLTLQRLQNPQLRQWLQVIERAALDGAQTVRRLQEFTRIRRDQPFVAVDLSDVVRDALEITQSRWRAESMSRGVAVEVRTSFAELPRVAGDAAELREAMTNLILNALDAMPGGGVLTLTTAVADGAVVVTVSDTGAGIPEAIRDKIFDPFFTTKGPEGTGLGLSMTYGILERHGARIAVESAEGRGTTFRMVFTPGAPVETEEAAPGAGAPSEAGSLRCLVVDDEPAVGAMLGDVLQSGGHRVVVVQDGGEAIARFSAEPFDVVFTDLAMPRVSGWQVARAIKEIAPKIPLFLVTGFGVELSAEERRAHGVDLVLVKPLKIQEILGAVAQAARRRVQPIRTEDE